MSTSTFQHPDSVIRERRTQTFRRNPEAGCVRIRLAGQGIDGPDDLDRCLRSVRDIEAALQIDTDVLAQELRRNASGEPTTWSFAARGGHVSLNSLETLRHVHERGLVLIAEIGEGGRYEPAGYLYGFDSLAEAGRLLPGFAVEDLDLPPAELAQAIAEADSTFCSWRVGVREECRRLGLVSHLRHAALHLALRGGKRFITANIASLCVSRDGAMLCDNDASRRASEGILLPWAWRRHHAQIIDREARPLCLARWLAFRNSVGQALAELEARLADKGRLDSVRSTTEELLQSLDVDGSLVASWK